MLLVSSAAGARSASAYTWTRVGLGAISQPAAVGDRLVLYAARGGSLELVALRARDGSTAWAATASPSEVTPGVAVTLAARAGAVFSLQPAGGRPGVARLVGRDARSGRILWRSTVGAFTTWPEICADKPTALCLTGSLPSGVSGELRFDAASGRQLTPVRFGAGDGRELTPGLFDPGTRNPDVLLATAGDRVAWRRPVSEIFTLPRASSDGGWNLDRVSRSGLFVGSVATTPRVVGGTRIIDLAKTMTAGFGIPSGHVAWRSAGFYACTMLPCPGGNEAGYSAPGTLSAGPTVGLREVMKGTGSFRSGAPPRLSADASVTIQGFDPATGKTRWSFDAGHNTGLITQDLVPERIDRFTIVMRNRAGRLVALDLRSGTTRRVSSSTRGWCRKTITYRLSNSPYYGGRSGEYAGQAALYPCSGNGRRIAPPKSAPALVARIGAAAGGIVAWADTNAVHAAAHG